MASRHFSLDMSDLGDVTDLVVDFQRQNSVRVELGLEVPMWVMPLSLVIEARAFDVSKGDVEPVCSGYVRLICSQLNLGSLGAVISRALYALDAQLALNEFGGMGNKEA